VLLTRSKDTTVLETGHQPNLEEIYVLETGSQPNLDEISILYVCVSPTQFGGNFCFRDQSSTQFGGNFCPVCVCVCCNCWLNVGQFRSVIISWQLIIKQSCTCNQAVFLETLESELNYETLAKINWDFFLLLVRK
jgi:hypothetical protein